MSQHSSQAVASECCAQHSYDNILGQVLKITFYGQSVSPPRILSCPFHAFPLQKLGRCRRALVHERAPGPTPHIPLHPQEPINTSQSPVTDGRQGSAGVSRGQEGARLGLGRGAGVFGIVVTWPVCLSVCRWMRSMWPPPPLTHHPSPTRALAKVRALIAGQERSLDGGGGGSVVIPDQSLRIYVFRLTQHPPHPRAPALEMCSVKPRRRECPKQTQH